MRSFIGSISHTYRELELQVRVLAGPRLLTRLDAEEAEEFEIARG